MVVWCTALPNTLSEQRSGLLNSEASKVTMNGRQWIRLSITMKVDVWIMVQVSMLKRLARACCKIFHTLVSMRQRLTNDYLITIIILAIDFRFGLVRLFDVDVVVIIVVITIISFLREA